MRLTVILLCATMCISVVAAKQLQSPKGTEQTKSLAVVRTPLSIPPPLPAVAFTPATAPVLPPAVKTNLITIWWPKLPDDQMYHVFGTNTQARLYTNFAVIQGRRIGSTNWAVVGSTNGTNVIYVGANANMLFRATAEWR